MTEVTRLVCGFPRCGSSVVMQMLAAGGAKVAGEYPAYEPEESGFDARRDPERWASMRGSVIKLLEPQRDSPPIGAGTARAVWLTRDKWQQAKSQAKFLRFIVGIRGSRREIRMLSALLDEEMPKAFRAIRQWTAADVRIVSFEAIMISPRSAAEAICGALDLSLDLDAMASAVIPRSAECYRGMLEDELLRRGVA